MWLTSSVSSTHRMPERSNQTMSWTTKCRGTQQAISKWHMQVRAAYCWGPWRKGQLPKADVEGDQKTWMSRIYSPKYATNSLEAVFIREQFLKVLQVSALHYLTGVGLQRGFGQWLQLVHCAANLLLWSKYFYSQHPLWTQLELSVA